jgi:hypothetical protein
MTDLSRELILCSAHDVCSMKHNALTTYKLLSHAGILYDETIMFIKAVYSEQDDQLDLWDFYDKYTAAITPLEECVFTHFAQVLAHNASACFSSSTNL